MFLSSPVNSVLECVGDAFRGASEAVTNYSVLKRVAVTVFGLGWIVLFFQNPWVWYLFHMLIVIPSRSSYEHYGEILKAKS